MSRMTKWVQRTSHVKGETESLAEAQFYSAWMAWTLEMQNLSSPSGWCSAPSAALQATSSNSSGQFTSSATETEDPSEMSCSVNSATFQPVPRNRHNLNTLPC